MVILSNKLGARMWSYWQGVTYKYLGDYLFYKILYYFLGTGDRFQITTKGNLRFFIKELIKEVLYSVFILLFNYVVVFGGSNGLCY